jgi:hypothetical protein
MFRFTIRDVLWLTVVVGMGLAWWVDHVALREIRIDKLDAERKAEFLLGVLRQDGYEIDAPRGIKGPISLPSHYQIIAEMDEGHIVPPGETNDP